MMMMMVMAMVRFEMRLRDKYILTVAGAEPELGPGTGLDWG